MVLGIARLFDAKKDWPDVEEGLSRGDHGVVVLELHV